MTRWLGMGNRRNEIPDLNPKTIDNQEYRLDFRSIPISWDWRGRQQRKNPTDVSQRGLEEEPEGFEPPASVRGFRQ